MRIDSGEYNPRLGDSYDNVARFGLSFQRSQNAAGSRRRPGRTTATTRASIGPQGSAAKRKEDIACSTGSRRSIEAAVGPSGQGHRRRRRQSDGGVHDEQPVGDACRRSCSGLKLTREAIGRAEGSATRASSSRSRSDSSRTRSTRRWAWSSPPSRSPPGLPEPTGPGAAFAPPALMAAPVPGQTFEVRARTGEPRRHHRHRRRRIRLEGDRGWQIQPGPATGGPSLERHQQATARMSGHASQTMCRSARGRTSVGPACRTAATRSAIRRSSAGR